jgi:hypothetical protein
VYNGHRSWVRSRNSLLQSESSKRNGSSEAWKIEEDLWRKKKSSRVMG